MGLEVVKADSLGAAASILASDEGAHVLGGGTLLVRDANSRAGSIGTIVLIDDPALCRIDVETARVTIGAAATMAQVAAHPGLVFLRAVANEIGGPAVRAMATVGGNLFAPSPYGDFAVALLALGAEVALEEPAGGRSVDLERFLARRGARASVVRSVSFAPPPAGAFRFAKVMRRHPHGASVLSIAAVLPVEDGRIAGARVAYGAMAPHPVRSRAVEAALEGRALDEATVAAAVAVATDGCSPASDPFASEWYRRNVLPVHLARLLKSRM